MLKVGLAYREASVYCVSEKYCAYKPATVFAPPWSHTRLLPRLARVLVSNADGIGFVVAFGLLLMSPKSSIFSQETAPSKTPATRDLYIIFCNMIFYSFELKIKSQVKAYSPGTRILAFLTL